MAQEDLVELYVSGTPKISKNKKNATPIQERKSTSLVLLLIILILIVNWNCSYPSLASGNHGQHIISAYNLGSVYLPGHSVWIFLLHIASRFYGLFFSSSLSYLPLFLAQFSNLCSAFSGFFIYSAVSEWTGRNWNGIICACLFCFVPPVWRASLIASPWSFHYFFSSFVLYASVWLYVRFPLGNQPSVITNAQFLKYLTLFNVIIMVGCSNNMILAFMWIPVLIYFLWNNPVKNGSEIFIIILGISTLFFCYMMIPFIHELFYNNIPFASFPESTSFYDILKINLWKFVPLQEYGMKAEDFIFEPSWNSVVFSEYLNYSKWNIFFSSISPIQWLTLPFIAIGIYAELFTFNDTSKSYHLRLCLLFLTVFFISTIPFSVYSLDLSQPIRVLEFTRLFPQLYCILFFFLGSGLVYLQDKFTSKFSNNRLLVISMAVVFLIIAYNYNVINQDNNDYSREYGKQILYNLPEHSIVLFHDNEPWSICIYLQIIENYRPDIKLLNTIHMSNIHFTSQQGQTYFPNIIFPFNGTYSHIEDSVSKKYNMNTFISKNIINFPIFTVGNWPSADPSATWYHKEVPYGLVNRLYPK